jgi:phosphatidylinositol alpha-1,6-mannosyltransferase
MGLPVDGPVIVSLSRLVPRKGMDVLIDAAAALVPSFPDLTVLIAGSGRDRARLDARVRDSGAPVRMLGSVPDDELPSLYGIADVFVMACRDRWLGLEQEGFGIVFLEAAACGVPQVAGRSGGADEAVVHGQTGLVVDDPGDPGRVAVALRQLLTNDELRLSMGRAARRRARTGFAWDLLAHRLAAALQDVEG